MTDFAGSCFLSQYLTFDFKAGNLPIIGFGENIFWGAKSAHQRIRYCWIANVLLNKSYSTKNVFRLHRYHFQIGTIKNSLKTTRANCVNSKVY